MWISAERPAALARITGFEDASKLDGTVEFFPMWDGVLVVTQLRDLPEAGEGIFAMHIHEGGRCSGSDFSDAGGHYNPTSALHPEHAGDLPPLFRCCDGRAYMAVITNRFRLGDVIGKTVIIHAGPDDFHTQPAGNSGARIGCGVIRRVY